MSPTWVCGSPGPTLTLVAELKKFIELRLAKGTSVIASCSGNILAQKTSAANNQLEEQRKSSEPGLQMHQHLFLFCHQCHLVLPEGLIVLLMQKLRGESCMNMARRDPVRKITQHCESTSEASENAFDTGRDAGAHL